MMLRLTEEEVHEELLKVDKWMVKDEKWIERKYMFSDYLKESNLSLKPPNYQKNIITIHLSLSSIKQLLLLCHLGMQKV